jgi:hypothetical protein
MKYHQTSEAKWITANNKGEVVAASRTRAFSGADAASIAFDRQVWQNRWDETCAFSDLSFDTTSSLLASLAKTSATSVFVFIHHRLWMLETIIASLREINLSTDVTLVVRHHGQLLGSPVLSSDGPISAETFYRRVTAAYPVLAKRIADTHESTPPSAKGAALEETVFMTLYCAPQAPSMRYHAMHLDLLTGKVERPRFIPELDGSDPEASPSPTGLEAVVHRYAGLVQSVGAVGRDLLGALVQSAVGIPFGADTRCTLGSAFDTDPQQARLRAVTAGAAKKWRRARSTT